MECVESLQAEAAVEVEALREEPPAARQLMRAMTPALLTLVSMQGRVMAVWLTLDWTTVA